MALHTPLEEKINAELAKIPGTGHKLDILGVLPANLLEELRGKVIALNLFDKKVIVSDSLTDAKQLARDAWPKDTVRFQPGPFEEPVTLEELEREAMGPMNEEAWDRFFDRLENDHTEVVANIARRLHTEQPHLKLSNVFFLAIVEADSDDIREMDAQSSVPIDPSPDDDN